MEKSKVDSVENFALSLGCHDVIMTALQGSPSLSTHGIPPFTQMEIAAIVMDEIEDYFEQELAATVCFYPTLWLRLSDLVFYSWTILLRHLKLGGYRSMVPRLSLSLAVAPSVGN
jgi:hypothetical protein